MKSSFAQLGTTWRALRRLKRSQIIGRLRLRSRQLRIRLFGLDLAVPRERRHLPHDWTTRIRKLASPQLARADELWPDINALRFRGNSRWLTTGSGCVQRYDRDFFPLELFIHDFVWKGTLSAPQAWDFLDVYLEGHRQRSNDFREEWQPYTVSSRVASWLRFLAFADSPESPGLRERLAAECLRLTDFLVWMLERDLEANHLLKNL